MNLLRAWLDRFEFGARKPLLVRRERISGVRAGKRLLFASDLHLKESGPRRIVSELAEAAFREAPDLVLLGGDLVDRANGLEALRSLVRNLSSFTAVCAVAGNHDEWIGVGRVRAAVVAEGGHWLGDAPWPLTPDCAVYSGREQPLLRRAKHHLLCTHHPRACSRPFALTLSGHLHGGQFVFGEWKGRLYPGALLYRWNGLRFNHAHGGTLLVSRGVQDTLPLRWNCPREVLVVDV